jgi:hypothetical protein
MYSDGSALRQATSGDCLRLLATVPIGRIIYTRQALPAVELVNFALEGGDIIIRTDRSGKLAAAARGAIVAFEADVVDLEHRSGWSVTAIGPSRAVADAADIARLQQIGLDAWVPSVREHFIWITPQLLTGRWLGAARPVFELGRRA